MHQEPERMQRQPIGGPLVGNRVFLTVLLIAYSLIWLLISVSSNFSPTSAPATFLNSIVPLLAIGDMILVLALDWRGYTTLSGLISWRTVGGKARFWLIFSCIFFFPIWLGIYLVRATYMAYRGIAPVYQQAPYQTPVPYHDYEKVSTPPYPYDNQQ